MNAHADIRPAVQVNCIAYDLTESIMKLVAEHRRRDNPSNPDRWNETFTTGEGIADLAQALTWLVPNTAEAALAQACVLSSQIDTAVEAMGGVKDRRAEAAIATVKRLAASLAQYLERRGQLDRDEMGLDYFCPKSQLTTLMPNGPTPVDREAAV